MNNEFAHRFPLCPSEPALSGVEGTFVVQFFLPRHNHSALHRITDFSKPL